MSHTVAEAFDITMDFIDKLEERAEGLGLNFDELREAVSGAAAVEAGVAVVDEFEAVDDGGGVDAFDFEGLNEEEFGDE